MDRLCPSVFVGLLDLDGKLRYANRAALEAGGVSAEAVIGKPFESTPWWSASESCRRRLRTAIKEASKGIPSRFDANILDACGRSRIVDFALEPVFGVDSGEHCLVASASDVTERRRIERTLRATQVAVDCAHEALFQVNAHAQIQYVNDSGCRLLGYSREELMSLHVWNLDADMPIADWPRWWSNLRPQGWLRTHRCARHRDGRRIPVIVAVNYIEEDGWDCAYVHIIDLSERAASEECIRRLMTCDAVTGLPNRGSLRENLASRVAGDAGDKSVLLLLVGLDRFKSLSDSLGHDHADRLLAEVARRLRNCFDKTTFIARLDLDVFAIVLGPEASHGDQLTALSRKVLETADKPVRVTDDDVYIGLSVAAIRSENDFEAERLIADGVVALNEARLRVDGSPLALTAARRGPDRERLRLEADLHRATEVGDFRLHYQPRLCAQSGALVSFEALLRWYRTGYGWVSPAQFVPIAEQTGLIVPIGDWVARAALTQARAWSVDHADRFGISINLSARQFRRRDLAASIAEMLCESGFDASRVELELTESMLIDNVDEAIATMHALKSLGLRLSLDDFGTGFSSLSYLCRFPIDTLKIDKSFVQQIDADDATEAVIDTIINMAHRLGLRVAAEGVETHHQLHSLRDKGCDEVQGFLLCAPMPADDRTLWAPRGDARSRKAIGEATGSKWVLNCKPILRRDS
jgi:diguanylate cyclase (GGDEF)-like protein/PAS domain S-box-containing protein